MIEVVLCKLCHEPMRAWDECVRNAQYGLVHLACDRALCRAIEAVAARITRLTVVKDYLAKHRDEAHAG